MAIAFVQVATKQDSFNTSTTITPSGAFTAGNVCYLWIWGVAVVGTVSDSSGYTWTQKLDRADPDGNHGYLYTATVTAATPTITVTYDNGRFINVVLSEYSGVDTSNPVDVSATAGVTSTTPSAGPTANAGANEVGVVFVSAGGSNFTVDSGFTERANVAAVPVLGVPMALAEKAVSSGTTFTGTYTRGANDPTVVLAAVLKLAGGGGATRPVKMAGDWGGFAGAGGGFAA